MSLASVPGKKLLGIICAFSVAQVVQNGCFRDTKRFDYLGF